MASKYLIDTSSLLAFVRYYLPFDVENNMKNYLLNAFKALDCLLLREVRDECRHIAQGIVFDTLELEKVKCAAFSGVIDSKMHNMIDNNFISSKSFINTLTQGEYEVEKNVFTQSADFKLIFFAMQNRRYAIITEETIASNDKKCFKKIPAICKAQKIECLTLPEFLKDKLKIHFYPPHSAQNTLF